MRQLLYRLFLSARARLVCDCACVCTVQVWCAVLGWYVEQRKHIQNEIRKYSDPPSDRLLPDNPPHMRCVPRLSDAPSRASAALTAAASELQLCSVSVLRSM